MHIHRELHCNGNNHSHHTTRFYDPHHPLLLPCERTSLDLVLHLNRRGDRDRVDDRNVGWLGQETVSVAAFESNAHSGQFQKLVETRLDELLSKALSAQVP